MPQTPDWDMVAAEAAAAGWTIRAVPAARLDEVRERAGTAVAGGGFPDAYAGHLAAETAFELPESPVAATVVIGATPRPATGATLAVGGDEYLVQVPPHYAGYFTLPVALRETLAAALGPSGWSAALVHPPLKTLAAGAGLARYGRNNLAYVAGLGSYLLLAACVTDAPPPEDAGWGNAQELERCARCSACSRACPTGAIGGDRFLLQTDRCLTRFNEDEEPFPDWLDPAWHHCAVGCLRCQLACPENAAVDLVAAPPEHFDAAETAAILGAAPTASLGVETREKLARCGLDYSPELIARNLRALIGAAPA